MPSNRQIPRLEVAQATAHEIGTLDRNVLRCRRWARSVILAGMMGFSACATVSSVSAVKPTIVAPKPVEDVKKLEGEEGHQNSKPKPKHRQKSDAESETGKDWGFPSLDAEDPSDDCMEIDTDKPGACDLA